MKKISYYILSFLLFILSLGTMSSCIDEDINIKRDGANAYIYNGERYIYTPEMEGYITMTSGEDYEIGYAYNGIGIKLPVQVSNFDMEKNVIRLLSDHHYPGFHQPFYVKETASFPSNPLEARYSSVSAGEEIKISFQLKEVLAGVQEPSDKDFSGMRWTMFCCYLENFHPICLQLSAYLDSERNIYVGLGWLGYYKIVDQEFRETVIEICKPYFP